MRIGTLILLLFVSGGIGFTQNLSLGVSYNYLHSKHLDNCVQLYNFSRPYLKNKQAFFDHGFNADAAFVFKNKTSIKHGISAGYSNFSSKAVNENYINQFNLHLINLNYVMRWLSTEKWKHFLGEVQLGASTTALYRRINGEAFIMDEERVSSYGIGGNMAIKLGYRIGHNVHQIIPFVSLTYIPYLFAPGNEAVLNATQGLLPTNNMNTLSFRVGVSYEINLRNRNKQNTESN